jgi:hypothetical protein
MANIVALIMLEKMLAGISTAPFCGGFISGKDLASGARSLKLERSQVSCAPPSSSDRKAMSAVLGTLFVIASSLATGTRMVPGSETEASTWQERVTSRSVAEIFSASLPSDAMMTF